MRRPILGHFSIIFALISACFLSMVGCGLGWFFHTYSYAFWIMLAEVIVVCTLVVVDYWFLLKERKALREALRALHDVQNGPPLYKYEEEWTSAMDNVRMLLGDEA